MKIKVKNHRGEEVEIKVGGELRAHVKKEYNSESSSAVKRYLASEGVRLKDVFRALGVEDIKSVNARSLLENDSTKPLFNAVVEDGLRMGFEKESKWQQLVAADIRSTQLTREYYELVEEGLDDEVQLRDIGQGAPIPVGTIKIGDQSIKMHKRGRGIEWTDEAKSMNIDMVSLFLKKMGKKLGRDYENTAVYRLLNGYFADGHDAAPTIGLKQANTLTLGDLFYAYKYMDQELGYDSKIMICNLNVASQIAELKDGNGGYLFSKEMKDGNFPNLMNQDPFVSNLMPDNRIMFVDTSFALVRYYYKEFGVEFERSAKTQVEGSYGTEISEFVPFMKDARLIITLDQAR